MNINSINVVESRKILFVDWTFATNLADLATTTHYMGSFYQDRAKLLQSKQNGPSFVDILNLAQVFAHIL